MKAKIQLRRLVRAATPYGVVVVRRSIKSRKGQNYCPICEKHGVFLPMPTAHAGERPKAICPNCGSLERHRLTWLFINRKVGLEKMANKSMLHVAPEAVFESKLRKLVGKKYLTADMYEKADVKMDITKIKYPHESFDIIMCNHVLEHVSDDQKAMEELYRVQKKDGWAILLAPIADMPTTYEDRTITSKKGRLEAFGQDDHVRKFGRDYAERIKKSGYNLEIIPAEAFATKREIRKMSLREDPRLWGFISSDIYFCTK